MEFLNRIEKVLNELSSRLGNEIYMIRLYPDFSGDIGHDTIKDFHKEIEFDNLEELEEIISKYEKIMEL